MAGGLRRTMRSGQGTVFRKYRPIVTPDASRHQPLGLARNQTFKVLTDHGPHTTIAAVIKDKTNCDQLRWLALQDLGRANGNRRELYRHRGQHPHGLWFANGHDRADKDVVVPLDSSTNLCGTLAGIAWLVLANNGASGCCGRQSARRERGQREKTKPVHCRAPSQIGPSGKRRCGPTASSKKLLWKPQNGEVRKRPKFSAAHASTRDVSSTRGGWNWPCGRWRQR